MKAAVLFQKGAMPQYKTDFPEPVRKADQIIVRIQAAALKPLDRSRATGRHYSAGQDLQQARVIGGDGVGTLPDGHLVYALGESGMLAEKALIDPGCMVPLPDGMNPVTAAALPNAVAGSAMALHFRASMKAGETVLIHGATGFTGTIAVQLARYYGAGKVIATGRNPQTLQALLRLGADQVVALAGTGADFTEQIRRLHSQYPIDVVLDYLWGVPAQQLLSVFGGGRRHYRHKTRYISVGAMAGDQLPLSAALMRSVDIQLCGSGLGSWTREQIRQYFRTLLPETFQLAAAGQLQVPTREAPLADIAKIWALGVPSGQRLVFTL